MDDFRRDVKALMSGDNNDHQQPASNEEYPAKLTNGYYRVRKTWSDKKSQLGAYKVLANAKQKADENKGYCVFTEDGTKIYPEEESKPLESEANQVHVVQSGDSLWKIAQTYLGDGSRYPEIKRLNGLTSNIIHAGQKLKLPVESYLKVGDKVKVTSTRYATGETIPGWVKERTHTVSQIEKDKVLLGWPDGICSWVPLEGVTKA